MHTIPNDSVAAAILKIQRLGVFILCYIIMTVLFQSRASMSPLSILLE